MISSSFSSQVDQIIVMKDGKISEIGTYDELVESKGAFSEFLAEQLNQEKEKPVEDGTPTVSDFEMELKDVFEDNLTIEDLQQRLLEQEERERRRRANQGKLNGEDL